MKWLTIDYIKEHSRIDSNAENNLLELYGSAAEEMCLNTMDRTYENLVAKFGSVPDPVKQASLMLVDLSYMQRSPISAVNMSAVPYTFDFLIKPYMKLTDDEEEEETGSSDTIILEVSYQTGSGTIAVDWSDYSYAGVKELANSGSYIVVRATDKDDETNTLFFTIMENWHEAVIVFKGITYTLALSKNPDMPDEPGDIVCAVTQ